MSVFRVALSADFRKSDGSPSFPEFDLSPLDEHTDIDLLYLEPEPEISAAQLAEVDALILLAPRVASGKSHSGHRTPGPGRPLRRRLRQRGCREACSANRRGARRSRPDGVRRPVAVSILTLMFALTGKLMVKDRPGPPGAGGLGREDGAQRRRPGRPAPWARSASATSGRSCSASPSPLDMRFIAHDPYADPDLGRRARQSSLVSTSRRCSAKSDVALRSPARSTIKPGAPGRAPRIWTLMKPSGLPDQHGARAGRRPGGAHRGAARNGRIAGAGLDVLEQEPPDADDPICSTLDNVIVTPARALLDRSALRRQRRGGCARGLGGLGGPCSDRRRQPGRRRPPGLAIAAGRVREGIRGKLNDVAKGAGRRRDGVVRRGRGARSRSEAGAAIAPQAS